MFSPRVEKLHTQKSLLDMNQFIRQTDYDNSLNRPQDSPHSSAFEDQRRNERSNNPEDFVHSERDIEECHVQVASLNDESAQRLSNNERNSAFQNDNDEGVYRQNLDQQQDSV